MEAWSFNGLSAPPFWANGPCNGRLSCSIALVGAVLGSIIAGITAPTEAASMGALGAVVVTAIGGRLSWSVLRETTYATT
jgi:TRAP-type mannitol/chloroaromatic compound transport system permease large subunit